MKTAEEWVKDSVFQHDKTQSDILFKAIIKQIQLDAWKQGMVDASSISQEEESIKQSAFTITAKILNAIEAKKEI